MDKIDMGIANKIDMGIANTKADTHTYSIEPKRATFFPISQTQT